MTYNSGYRSMSIKAVAASAATLSTAVMLHVSGPSIVRFVSAEIPKIYCSLISWLTPPYLYFVINGIIISIAASSRFQKSGSDDVGHIGSATASGSGSAPDVKQQEFIVVSAPAPVVEEKVTVQCVLPAEYGTAALGKESNKGEEEVEKVEEEEEEEEFVISRSSWTPRRETVTEIPTEYSVLKEKPLVSARLGRRKSLKSSPEASRAALGVARSKRYDTLESTWKAITDGRAIPLTRHMKKSDTWETHHTRASRDDPPSPEEAVMRKFETFHERGAGGGARRPPMSGSPSPLGASPAARLRKEPSLGQDDLNRRVEAFIKKFNQEMRLQRQLSNTAGTKSSSESQSRPLELGDAMLSNGSLRSRETIDLSESLSPYVVEDMKIEKLCEDTAGLKSRDKGKGIDLCSNSKLRKGCISSSFVEKTDISFEAGSQKFSSSIDGVKCSSSTGTAGRDNEKVVDLCRDSELINGQPRRPRSAQRRLVRNGCISPLNIERSRNFRKQKEVENSNNGGLSRQVQIISPDSQEKRSDKMKGKVTAEDIVASQSVHDRSHVNCGLPGREGMAISDVEGGNHWSRDDGWITTRNHTRQPSIFPTWKTDSILKSEDAFSHPFDGSHEVAMANGSSVNVVHADTELPAMQHGTNSIQDSQELQTESQRINGKRKLDSSGVHVGECSSSISSGPVSLNLGASRQPLNSGSTRSRRSWRDGLILGRVIEVDELQSPEAVSNSVDRDRQVESDEMLARQLQEELYNETPRIGNTDEFDASLALLLQENDGHDASRARRNQARRRDLSSSSIRSRFRQNLQNPGQGANPARVPTSSRRAQARRDLQMRRMDLDRRLDILGAAAFDGGGAARVNNILHIQRDFNQNDYEMLLALDDNNHQHGGASVSQINNLPQSIIQNVDSQEACAVCLEPPAVGDTIRHLPCLHKFHKDCIDTWLRRKRLCPICKNEVR